MNFGKEITWNDIERHIAACTQCPLGQTRNLPVMGRGSHEADIMLIAEAPGAQEDQQVNRDHREEEKEACFPYLKYETFLLKPGIIVCLGRVAAQRIISPDFKITRQHGTWTYRRNCMLTATYHPSAILRDPSKYDEVKRDLQEVVSKRSDLKR